jgi:hypothetical protein
MKFQFWRVRYEPYDRAEFTGHSHGNVVLVVSVKMAV